MKRCHALMLCVVLLLTAYVRAQQPPLALTENKAAKPFLFSSVPDQFECSSTELQKIISSEINGQFSVQLSSQFIIKGKVVDKNQQNTGSFSINSRLSNYDNALFNISVTLLADNSVSIHGRIIHPKYNDVLILYKEKDKYFFKKQLQRLYMTE